MAIGNGETLPRARSFDNEPSYEIRYRYESDRRRKFEKRVTKSIYNRFWPTRTHTSSAPIVIDDAGTTITVVLEHFRLLFFSLRELRDRYSSSDIHHREFARLCEIRGTVHASSYAHAHVASTRRCLFAGSLSYRDAFVPSCLRFER